MSSLRINKQVGFRVIGSGSAFPGPVTDPSGREHEQVSNEDIYRFMLGENWPDKCRELNLDPAYPEEVVGLSLRKWTHWVGAPISHNETNSADLACRACRAAIDSAGLRAADIDLFILATTSPIRITSSTATHVAGRLDIEAPALEMKAGCSSGIYAILTAAAYINLGARRVLVAGAETMSKFATPTSREAIFNIGDGAGALVLQAEPDGKAGLLSGMIDSDGKLGEVVCTPGQLPPTREAVEKGLYFYAGDAKQLKAAVTEKYPLVFRSIFSDASISPLELDLYIPHQVNKQITLATTSSIGISPEKTFVNLHLHGNLGGACIFVALHEAIEQKRIKPGALVGTAVVGGGLTWGGLVLRF